MSLSARRRSADLAATRSHATAVAYRQSVGRLQSRLRHDWKFPLACGLGSGMLAGLFPLAATLRVGSGLLRFVASMSQVPYGALARLARNAQGKNDSASA